MDNNIMFVEKLKNIQQISLGSIGDLRVFQKVMKIDFVKYKIVCIADKYH
jgi:hypothetical protein